jgi:hypothetical protein
MNALGRLVQFEPVFRRHTQARQIDDCTKGRRRNGVVLDEFVVMTLWRPAGVVLGKQRIVLVVCDTKIGRERHARGRANQALRANVLVRQMHRIKALYRVIISAMSRLVTRLSPSLALIVLATRNKDIAR